MFVCDGGRLVGVITRKTLVREIVATGLDPRETTVGAIAEPPRSRSRPGSALEEAFRALEEHDLERVPVVEDGRLVGVLSRAASCSAGSRRTSRRADESRSDRGVSAAGVGAGRGAPLGLGQLGAARAAPSSRSRSLDLERVEAEDAERLPDDHRAGDDHRRALGLERPGPTRRSVSGSAASRSSCVSSRRRRDVAVHEVAVVRVEPEVERGEAS